MSDGGEGVVTVHIRCSNGTKFSVEIELDSTVGTFKSFLSRSSDIPADQQRLIYKGRILKDDQTLRSYGLEADHTVHLVRGFTPTVPTNSSPATNVMGSNNPQAGTGSNEGRALGESDFGNTPFPGLRINGLGDNGSPFSGLPNIDQVHQQLSQNPNMVREMMNMPAVQNLMNNPEVLQNMIMNNPQMREIIDRNPEIAHILNDPNILRQSLETARNPKLMREMMRNTDRAMSNIESSPEGFNMLRRMYENVQEPMLQARTRAGNVGNDLGSNLSNTGSETATGSPAPNANPLPNPWAPVGAQTNSTSRLNPLGDARQPPPVGLGLPDFESMFGSTQDTSSLNQLLQNPAVSQMMQSLLSNPQQMNQLGGTTESNSQLREMMQNPEILWQLSSPETMQQLLTFQQSLMSQLGRQQPTQDSGQTGGGTGAVNNTGLQMLMNMFGGPGGGMNVPSRSNEPPEQLYATQLAQLQEMGFFDRQENIRALTATAGNVNAAIERLLGNLG